MFPIFVHLGLNSFAFRFSILKSVEVLSGGCRGFL